MRSLLSLALVGTSLSACLHHAPFTDPFAGLGTRAPAFAALKLGLVVSENTVASERFFREGGGPWGGGSAQVVDEFVGLFRRNFGSVMRLSRAEDAASTNVDVLAVLDVRGEIRWGMRVHAKAVFLTTAQAPLAALESKYMERGVGASIPRVIQRAAVMLEGKLVGEPKLLAFASARSAPSASPPPAFAAPAPAPALPEVEAPPYRLLEDARRFALVIGISKYKGLPEADFAERDAAAMRRYLLAMGYPERNIILLLGDNATRTGIQKYVQEWLPRNARAGSSLFVYFSGHGAPDPTTGEAYLVPWDADPQFLQSTAYPLRQLYGELGRLGASQIIVALDACFSGSGGRSVLAKGARPLVVVQAEDAAVIGRLAVLSAAARNQITGSLAARGHGLFTYYLLEGLRGGARGPSGAITAQSLLDYLKPKVADEARRQNREQTPALLGAGGGVELLR